ncbi:MAG: O-antigen ligase family protein [Prevotella sp.]|nr:O-antigen ligase family protein [Prevotella sp.]
MAKIYSNRLSEFSHENGGRVLLLFLLFLLAIYEFVNAGFTAFAIICLLPFVILYVYVAFRWRMFTFWTLIAVNYFIQMKDISLPVPMSLPNEILEIILLAIAVIDARQSPHFERAGNMMLFALTLWFGFCCIELLNDTCNLGMNVGAWFTGFRLMTLQLLWIFLIFTIYISSPKILITYLRIWALFSLFSAFWTWKQQTYGFTTAENIWMETVGRRTHILNAGTLIRYFSTFSDAANYGCHAAGAAVAFILTGISSKIIRDKLFFLLISAAVIWGMFQSGTRTAIFCLGAGLLVYVVLSKSIKIATPFLIAFLFFAFILVFTNIGNGNQQIRRMRSAFNKEDASASVRDINKEAIRGYIKDAPWGIGLGMGWDNVPANNKYFKLATVPPDSEYVFIWIRTGPIGITIFLISMAIMFLGACSVVLFKLKSRALIGIGSGLCGAFVAIQLGAYGNQVLYQYPNGVTFFGGLAIVYILPYLEPEWNKYEEKRLAEQEERKRLKLEKKLASRV